MKKRTALIIVAGTSLVFPLLGTSIAAAAFMPGGIGDSWYDLVLNPQGGNPLEYCRR